MKGQSYAALRQKRVHHSSFLALDGSLITMKRESGLSPPLPKDCIHPKWDERGLTGKTACHAR